MNNCPKEGLLKMKPAELEFNLTVLFILGLAFSPPPFLLMDVFLFLVLFVKEKSHILASNMISRQSGFSTVYPRKMHIMSGYERKLMFCF